jgi:putative SOS response-associated peptidase YedK
MEIHFGIVRIHPFEGILPEEHHEAWLSGEAGKEVLVPFPADRMKAWPISSRVNSPKNNDDEIIVPFELESVVRSLNHPELF